MDGRVKIPGSIFTFVCIAQGAPSGASLTFVTQLGLGLNTLSSIPGDLVYGLL